MCFLSFWGWMPMWGCCESYSCLHSFQCWFKMLNNNNISKSFWEFEWIVNKEKLYGFHLRTATRASYGFIWLRQGERSQGERTKEVKQVESHRLSGCVDLKVFNFSKHDHHSPLYLIQLSNGSRHKMDGERFYPFNLLLEIRARFPSSFPHHERNRRWWRYLFLYLAFRFYVWN